MQRPCLFLYPWTDQAFSFSAKSLIASDILICCGHTFSQLRHPTQPDGRFSGGNDITTAGMNGAALRTNSLYKSKSLGMPIPCGQWLTQ